MSDDLSQTDVKKLIEEATSSPDQQASRRKVLDDLPGLFEEIGNTAFVVGHIVGRDRVEGASPFGHGNDAMVAVARLFHVAGKLSEGAYSLFEAQNCYAGSALVRQLVEIEYLMWTFVHEPESAAQWLRSDKKERMKFFTPREMRKRSEGYFRKSDYSNHCELGGHPVPRANVLLNSDERMAELMMSDCIMHCNRILRFGAAFLQLDPDDEKSDFYKAKSLLDDWLETDKTNRLPPSPEVNW